MTSSGITTEFEKEAEKFYRKILELLTSSPYPFLIGGTYAVRNYTGVDRLTKDIYIFCKPGDYPKILKMIADTGNRVAAKDVC